MMLHILRTAAGCQTVDELADRIHAFSFMFRKQKYGRFTTRNTPKRAAEILESGGSVYWIVKNRIQVRNKIIAIEADSDGCTVIFDPVLIQTWALAQRAVQGWRYLEAAKAPKDRGLYIKIQDDSKISADLAALGLL